MLASGVMALIAGVATMARGDMMWGVLLAITGVSGVSNALWHLGVLGPDPRAGNRY